jgi:hypothetical protein
MLSGTSMAAPHVAGLAALIKQKFRSFSPAAIASALSTTTTLSDRQGKPIMAQRTYSNPDSTQSPATAFDMGNGFVNATAALDPGIIFDCGKFYTCLHSGYDTTLSSLEPSWGKISTAFLLQNGSFSINISKFFWSSCPCFEV